MQNPTVLPSERSFSPETVCVPCSGVYLARALNPKVPGTNAEVQALAVDMGAPNGVGANFAKLQTGLFKRYKLASEHYEGAAASQAKVLAAAAAGPVLVALAGDQVNLTPSWQPGNHVGHAILVMYEHGTTGVQLDPLAPAGYAGDPFGPDELAAFTRACLIVKGPTPAPPADPCADLKVQLANAQADIVGLKARLASINKISNGSPINFIALGLLAWVLTLLI